MKLQSFWGPSLWAAVAFFLIKPQEALSVRLGVAPTEALNGVIAAEDGLDIPAEDSFEDDGSFAQLQDTFPGMKKDKKDGKKGKPEGKGGSGPTLPNGAPIPEKAKKRLGIE
ncbi:hypothetical protein Emag_000147 [Eimeria magna]